MTIPKINLRRVHKSFGEKVVLDGINLEVASGESLVIIGGSGSGKSVTLKCILGLMTPDSGQIEVDGESIIGISRADREQINRSFGMLIQSAALFDSMLVWGNVALGLIQGERMDRTKAKDIAMKKLATVGLEADVGELWPAELFGGMQKRVGLARAIATEPKIMFFDEPTTGLDPIMGDIINDLIIKCVRELDATALLITHDMASARKISDHIAMLYKGKVIWIGKTTEIDSSGEPQVDQFIDGRAEGPIQMELRRL